METIEIKGTVRKQTGKKHSKSLRREANVPCVMYGGEEIIHFFAPELSFSKIIYTPKVYHLKIDLDGKSYDALLQDIQFHPVTDRILHLDFKQVSFDREVVTFLPVIITGDAEGIKEGGKLRQRRRRLKVKGLLKDMPDYLEIDITSLEIGDSFKIGDLEYGNLTLLETPRAMVVAVASSRLAKGMEEAIVEVEEEEVVEGEEEAAETEASETTEKTPESGEEEKKAEE